MTRTLSESDQRQYQLMADRLKGFEKRTISLNRLINDLEALLDVLQAPEGEWKAAFRSEWGTLEVVCAVALDRGETVLSPEGKKWVEEAVENMNQLLKQQLRKCNKLGV